jgi:hypothetical protein
MDVFTPKPGVAVSAVDLAFASLADQRSIMPLTTDREYFVFIMYFGGL